MGKMVGIICRALASDGIMRYAKHLNLSIPETRKVVLELQKLYDHILPASVVWENMKKKWRSLTLYSLDHFSKKTDTNNLFWWPGLFGRKFLSNGSTCLEIESRLYDPYIRLPKEPWRAIRVQLDKIGDNEKEIRKRFKGLNFFWIRYFFLHQEYFVDLFCTSSGSMVCSIVTQDYSSRQSLLSAQWALAVHCYFKENGTWPKFQEEIEEMVGITLPDDFHSGTKYIFRQGSPPDIRGVGPDMVPDTEDDSRCILF